jgi:dipeptidyl aminopeptidase/acylaminoacyl peptidase
MRRFLGLLAALATATALLTRSAGQAVANHVQCGDVITQDTTLDSDLIDCPGDGLVIGADNITLDLNGHTIDGTGLRRIADRQYPYHGGSMEIAWSPDGTKLAFGRTTGQQSDDLMVVNADGSGLTWLASGWAPVWSPNGSKIAFLNELGSFISQQELYVMDADGSHQIRLTRSAGSESDPSCRLTGRRSSSPSATARVSTRSTLTEPDSPSSPTATPDTPDLTARRVVPGRHQDRGREPAVPRRI